MHASSPIRADTSPPPRLRAWAAASIAASIVAVYIVILAMPKADSDRQSEHLHAALAVLGGAIPWVEASYADGNLDLGSQRLGLPASAAFCAQLSIHLPGNGRARLSCELRTNAWVRGTLRLDRNPQGAWTCVATVPDPRLLPAACRSSPMKIENQPRDDSRTRLLE